MLVSTTYRDCKKYLQLSCIFCILFEIIVVDFEHLYERLEITEQ